MHKLVVIVIGLTAYSTTYCFGQQSTAAMPNAPQPHLNARSSLTYTPPTQKQRFRSYIGHTFGLYSILEAAARGGIAEARDAPSQWPDNGQGYADRFGSVAGEVAVRSTTEYLVSDLFHEDLRVLPCNGPCSGTAFSRALEDTFTARKGVDGHRAFSVARLVGPIAGAAVAKNTWYPSGYGKAEVLSHVGLSYSFSFLRHFIRECRKFVVPSVLFPFGCSEPVNEQT